MNKFIGDRMTFFFRWSPINKSSYDQTHIYPGYIHCIIRFQFSGVIYENKKKQNFIILPFSLKTIFYHHY
ncbi:hypothetical protein DERF_006619 [Dermatophagoides farinae]|uniref:Uncharacterized protein n=1 Tax=Dermatophagoides farinae TaxID=6954 RepID=A0A922L3Q4_DERFA|nr:hypothetical protein DERF_006619 [Dermatophagoides farinae]